MLSATSRQIIQPQKSSYYFEKASHNSHSEESELSSEIIFNGASENSEEKRSKVNGSDADEADRIRADAESTDDVLRRAADRRHLDANGAGAHEIVNAGAQHPESDVNSNTGEAGTVLEVVPHS